MHTQVDAGDLFKAMQGRWQTVYTEIDGQLGLTETDHFLIYKDNTFTVEKAGKVAHEGRFSFNTSLFPVEIVYIYSKSFPIYLGGPRAGIIQLQAGTLKCCFAALGQPAPKDFNTFPGLEAVLTVHQRADGDARPRRIVKSLQGASEGW
jgi:uncharacterized protein (TIGR03067 family)